MGKFKEFLASPENENLNGKRFNEDLIYTLRHENLAEYVVKVFRMLECKYIKILNWEVITDESKFDPNKINQKHIKNNKNKKFDKRIPINNSRYDLLKIDIRISTPETTYVKTIELLLFKRVDNYYYLMDGNRYYPIYQLVDASVYNRKDYLIYITHSSPIVFKRGNETIMDINGDSFMIQTYNLCMYKEKINTLIYFFAMMGVKNTLIYMQMDDIIKIDSYKDYDEKEQYCFLANNGKFIKVIKYFFDNDNFTRNITYSLLTLITEDMKYLRDVKDPNHINWIKKLGDMLTKNDIADDKKFIKGKGFLLTFANLLDPFTKDELRVKSYNKSSIFAVMRWILRNFNELKMKENMNIKNKRIRMAEYMAYYLVVKLNQRKRKFIMAMSSGEVTHDNVEELLSMDQDFFIKAVTGSKSSLMKYDNSVNDSDMFVSLKYSLKGPNSIGEKSGNSVSINYRDIDESYVGIIDINSTSNSDPGMSGNFTPFAKLYGKFFTDEQEPQTWDEDFAKLYKNYFNKENIPIKPLDYYYKKEKKSRKKLINLDNVNSFINDNPHIGNKQLFFDLNDKKIKIIKLTDTGKIKKYTDISTLTKAIKVEEIKIKKKTRGRKKKKPEIKIKKIRIKRL